MTVLHHKQIFKVDMARSFQVIPFLMLGTSRLALHILELQIVLQRGQWLMTMQYFSCQCSIWLNLTHLTLLSRGSVGPDRIWTMVTPLNIWSITYSLIKCIWDMVTRYVYVIYWLLCPLTGTRSIYTVTKYGKVLPYIREKHPQRERDCSGLLGFEDLSRFDSSICNSDTDLVGHKNVSMFDQVCVSRVLPVPSTHRLFEGNHPSYTTPVS